MAIICGTDLSEASAGALEVACALAAQAGEPEVVLIHVIDPELGDGQERSDAIEKARGELEATSARRSNPSVRTELVVGPPEESLCGFAETENSELIVIAARSSEGSLLGRTAEKIVQRSVVPVLVVRDPAPWLGFAKRDRTLRVLLGLDESASSDLGIEWVRGMRARGPVEVVLGAIYYTDEAAAYYGLGSRHLVDKDPEIEQLLSRDLTRRFGNPGPGGSVTARARRGLGRIGDHVIELATEEKVDVIVVGTSQKTGLGRLGSVSSVVIREAPQSVVCVPPNAQVATVGVPLLDRAMVATDLSAFANRAVPYAFAISRGEVHLVHVVKEDDEVDEDELVRSLRALAPANARQTIVPHVVRGDDAATALAQTAARLGVDVVCIASHGRAGLTRAIVGSVADRLLRATRVPILVLRPG